MYRKRVLVQQQVVQQMYLFQPEQCAEHQQVFVMLQKRVQEQQPALQMY
jgi:hypothetical protein